MDNANNLRPIVLVAQRPFFDQRMSPPVARHNNPDLLASMTTLSKLSLSIRRDQILRRRLQGLSQFQQRPDGRIAGSALQAADVLLAAPGFLRKLLLSQATGEPEVLHIPPDQLPHVHADWLDGYRRADLSL